MNRIIIIAMAFAALFLIIYTGAEVPQMLSYQGYLEENGSPVTGSRDMVFSIYDAAEGGSQLWSSGTVEISVQNGGFSYLIGSDSALTPECLSGADRWLGIQILPDNEIVPRTRLSAVPYAYQTLRADTAEVGGGWVIGTGQRANSKIWPVDLETSVGIGTDDPTAKLHVTGPLAGEDFIRAGDSTFVIPDDGPILVGRMLHIQNYDLGYFGGSCSDDIFVEDSLAVVGLYSANGYGNLGSAVTLGQVVDGSFSDKWALVRENQDGPLGGNGLRFTYGIGTDPSLNSTFVRMDSDGDVGIGRMDPGNHRLYVESDSTGVGGATAFISNTSEDGIGMIVENDCEGLTMIVSQKGERPNGEIFRCDSWTGGWHAVFRVMNTGRVKCKEVELTGGVDLAEPFEISDENSPIPGAVMVIDDMNPGKLTLSNRPYDIRVAGIVSGAGGINPAITLTQKDNFDSGPNIAISGRVYCLADASFGAIRPGDMLTTSSTPGYAMKAIDRDRSYGAVIGKAMTELEEGRGLVLVLVSLQ